MEQERLIYNATDTRDLHKLLYSSAQLNSQFLTTQAGNEHHNKLHSVFTDILDWMESTFNYLISKTSLLSSLRIKRTSKRDSIPSSPAPVRNPDSLRALYMCLLSNMKELPQHRNYVKQVLKYGILSCAKVILLSDGMSNYWSRNWLKITASCFAVYTASKYLSLHQTDILDFMSDIKISVWNFTHEYIIKPIRGIYEIIRYTDKQHIYVNVVDMQGLNEDIESLGRLVTQYVIEHPRPNTPLDIHQVEDMAKKGNKLITINALIQCRRSRSYTS